MARRNNIKWRDKDLKELKRVIRNFNSKVGRVSKKLEYIDVILPEKVSVKNLKSKITTRQDFNREINKLKRFSRKGVENVVVNSKGVKITEYEVKEAKLMTKLVNQRRAKEKKEAGFEERKGVDFQTKERGLNPKTFSVEKGKKEWEKFVKSLEKEVMSSYREDLLENYKQNYLGGLAQNLGVEGNRIAEKLKNIDPLFLYQQSLSNPVLTIDFFYDPIQTEIMTQAIDEAWQEVI